MPTFTAYFSNDREVAVHDIDADTPEAALALAQARDPTGLNFDYWEGFMPVLEISVTDEEGHELDRWEHDDLRLRRAARRLLEAAERVIANWQEGDLAKAVRDLSAAVDRAKPTAK